jgi:hypothetical protein
MSKTWPLLVLVNLKYCAEKRLFKTHVAFFMKVAVHCLSHRSNSRYFIFLPILLEIWKLKTETRALKIRLFCLYSNFTFRSIGLIKSKETFYKYWSYDPTSIGRNSLGRNPIWPNNSFGRIAHLAENAIFGQFYIALNEICFNPDCI